MERVSCAITHAAAGGAGLVLAGAGWSDHCNLISLLYGPTGHSGHDEAITSQSWS